MEEHFENGKASSAIGESERLDLVFGALSDATRRAILARLASEGECSVTQLAEPFAMSLPAITKHLKVLERAELISRGRDAQWRPCRLEAAALQNANDWIEQYRRFWEASFDRLDEYLREVQQAEKQRENENGNDNDNQQADR